MNELSLIVLAAGLGSRYGGLKQMDSVGPHGELLIEYSIFDALNAGMNHIVFVIQASQESAFREVFESKLRGRCRVSYAHQSITDVPAGYTQASARGKPWGTGHAVWSARHFVCGPFAVINADDFYGPDSFARLARFLQQACDSPEAFAMVGFELRKTLVSHGTVSRGVCRVGESGCLLGIDEQVHVGLLADAMVYWDDEGIAHPLPESSVASMNMWAFPHAFMRELGDGFERFLASPQTDPTRDEFFLPSAVNALSEAGRAIVHVLPTSTAWMGVTYREDLDHVRQGIQAMIERGIYPNQLWNESR